MKEFIKRLKVCFWLCIIQTFKDLFAGIICIISSIIIIIGFFVTIVFIIKDISIALDILTITIFGSILLFFIYDLITDSWRQSEFVMKKIDKGSFTEINKIDLTDTFTRL